MLLKFHNYNNHHVHLWISLRVTLYQNKSREHKKEVIICTTQNYPVQEYWNNNLLQLRGLDKKIRPLDDDIALDLNRYSLIPFYLKKIFCVESWRCKHKLWSEQLIHQFTNTCNAFKPPNYEDIVHICMDYETFKTRWSIQNLRPFCKMSP